MWRAIRDQNARVITFPHCSALECSTLSCVSVNSGVVGSDAVLLSIGGYGDEDAILGMYYTKIQVVESPREVVLRFIGESADKSPWQEVHRDQILICSADGKCILCCDIEKQEKMSAFTAVNPVDVLRVEGHTAVVVESSQCAHQTCHCSLSDAICQQVGYLHVVENSNLCDVVIDISDTVVLFGGINEEYELSNEMHFIRIASVRYTDPKKRTDMEASILLVDFQIPQKGTRPSPRCRHSAIAKDGYHYIFGGDIDDSLQQSTVDCSTFYRFRLDEGFWETLSMPCESFFHHHQKSGISNNHYGSHSLASLTVLDAENLILIGGYDFNGSSKEDSCAHDNGSWISRSITVIRQQVFSRVSNFLEGCRATEHEARISHCEVYNTRSNRWSPVWYRKVLPSGVHSAEVNGHVSLGDSNGTVMWCFGKRNANNTESLHEPPCVARGPLSNEYSDDIDDRFTGDQHGEMHSISRMECNERPLCEWIYGSIWTFFCPKKHEKFVFDYTRKLIGNQELFPRGLYMASGCLAHLKIVNPTHVEYVATHLKAPSSNINIMLVMGGNRRHPDETIGTACWYLITDFQ